LHVVLRHTRWGLHTIAAGANPVGVREAGLIIDLIHHPAVCGKPHTRSPRSGPRGMRRFGSVDG
jgi:hypothetical protein